MDDVKCKLYTTLEIHLPRELLSALERHRRRFPVVDKTIEEAAISAIAGYIDTIEEAASE